MGEMKITKTNNENQEAKAMLEETSYVKKVEEPEGRKLFANKKANIALIVAGVVTGLIVVAMVVISVI